MEECDFSVTVVGLGLIGGSYAEAFTNMKFKRVLAVDLDETAILKAKTKGIIEQGYTEPKEALLASDLVVISLYPEATIKFVKDNLPFFKKGAIITDTAGLKEGIVKSISDILPEDIDFIGGHPMAGREGKGIDMATCDIFKGASYIITPVEKNNTNNIEFLKDILYKMGIKNITEISPKLHDEIIAYTSQLPHILAVALINSINPMDIDSFVGGGFKDLTRIAVNNSQLWTELLLNNKENLLESIEEFQLQVEKIKKAINDGDYNSLKYRFESANQKRRGIK